MSRRKITHDENWTKNGGGHRRSLIIKGGLIWILRCQVQSEKSSTAEEAKQNHQNPPQTSFLKNKVPAELDKTFYLAHFELGSQVICLSKISP